MWKHLRRGDLLSSDSDFDRKLLIVFVAALMLGSGMVIVMASPYGHGNNVSVPVPVKTPPSPVITPLISPTITLTAKNPAVELTNLTLTANVSGFQPSEYHFYLESAPGGPEVYCGPSNKYTYFIPLYSPNLTFQVVVNTPSGCIIGTGLKIRVIEPPCVFINSTSPNNHASRGIMDLSSNPIEFMSHSLYPGIPPFSYQWYINGNTIPGATGLDLNYTFNSTGQYRFRTEWTDNTNGTIHHFFSDNYTEIVDPPLKDVVRSSHNPSDIGESITYTVIPSGSTDKKRAGFPDKGIET